MELVYLTYNVLLVHAERLLIRSEVLSNLGEVVVRTDPSTNGHVAANMASPHMAATTALVAACLPGFRGCPIGQN